MLHIVVQDPSPFMQTTIYMGGMLVGYLLLTRPDEWAEVRETVRALWERRRND
jgi:hypothetical protein